MKILRLGNQTLYLAESAFQDLEREKRELGYSDIESLHPYSLKRVFSQAQREYIELYSSLIGVNNLGILDAHSSNLGRHEDWTFRDGKKDVNIQNWVNRTEKDHHCLALLVCNGHRQEVVSKKAILVYPFANLPLDGFGEFNPNRPDSQPGHVFSMYVPNIGFVDDYTVDYHLNKLREKLNTPKND